jgi:PhzF family phenazine biosynthesis protein
VPRYKFDQTISNAFCEDTFRGSPASTVLLKTKQWLPAIVMQAIAEQNNLPETTFLLRDHAGMHIRWFTPQREVYLAGHASLAAAHKLFGEDLYKEEASISFLWKSGQFSIKRDGHGTLWMEYERCILSDFDVTDLGNESIANCVKYAFLAQDTVFVLNSASAVSTFDPSLVDHSKLPGRGLAITAASDSPSCDYVSRFFCPNYGVPEDPVTGSSHAVLALYWANRLSKNSLIAHQLSPRGGVVRLEVGPEKVLVGGRAELYCTASCSFDFPSMMTDLDIYA